MVFYSVKRNNGINHKIGIVEKEKSYAREYYEENIAKRYKELYLPVSFVFSYNVYNYSF